MMSEPVRTIRRYVNRNYGDAVTVDSPVHETDKGLWVAELWSDYPRRIHDDYNKESFVKFLELRELGEIILTEDNRLSATPREELIERLESRLQQWREKAQEIVLASSADELANLQVLKDAIFPITLLVSTLARKGKHEITHEELKKAHVAERWAEFLVQIKLLKPTESGFTYSSLFTSLEQETATDGKEEFVNHVVAHIMRNYYNMIRQVFKVWRFETYLHAATCYYAPSIQAGRMLYRNPDSLNKLYHKWYSKSYSDLRLPLVFDELVRQKILTRVNGYLYGSSEIWAKLEPLIPLMPQVITARRG